MTPNHNYSEFLEATIRSVLDQNYANLEYIVIDDGSTDSSVDIIRRYEDRLAYWQTGPNQGQYRAITSGFARSTGEVMAWINSDDMYMPWTFKAVGDIFATFPEVEWITTLQPAFWDYYGLCILIVQHPGFSREAFLDGLYLQAPGMPPRWAPPLSVRMVVQQESTFWRRSLWEKVGGYVSSEYGSAGDFDLWARFYEHSELVAVDIPLSGFRVQYRQQTSNLARYSENCIRSLEAARTRAGWKPPRGLRRVSYQLKLMGFPFLRPLVRNSVGYTGTRLFRAEERTPQARWELEPYRFL